MHWHLLSSTVPDIHRGSYLDHWLIGAVVNGPVDTPRVNSFVVVVAVAVPVVVVVTNVVNRGAEWVNRIFT